VVQAATTMKVVALVSGGKDSCYAMMKAIHYGRGVFFFFFFPIFPKSFSIFIYLMYLFVLIGVTIDCSIGQFDAA